MHKIKSNFFNIEIPPKQKTGDYSQKRKKVSFFVFNTRSRDLVISIFRYSDGGESGRKELKFENETEFEIVFHLVGEVETFVSPEVVDFFEFVTDEKAGVDNAVSIPACSLPIRSSRAQRKV